MAGAAFRPAPPPIPPIAAPATGPQEEEQEEEEKDRSRPPDWGALLYISLLPLPAFPPPSFFPLWQTALPLLSSAKGTLRCVGLPASPRPLGWYVLAILSSWLANFGGLNHTVLLFINARV